MPHEVDEAASLVGAVTSWCPSRHLCLCTATHSEKNVPEEEFHRSGCYIKHGVTAEELLLLLSSRRAERLLPTHAAQTALLTGHSQG